MADVNTDHPHGRVVDGRSVRAKWIAVVFGGWVIAASVPIASLMASHWVPLPAGGAAAPAPGRSPLPVVAGGRWRAIHVLAGGCPCSAAVAAALASRGPSPEVDESAVVVGDDTYHLAAELHGRAFGTIPGRAEQLLASLGVRGGPWLVLIGPDGRVAYSGGYAPERPRAGTALQDAAIRRRLLAGEHVAPFPAYGCATDAGLKRTFDPLGLKYR